MGKSEEDYQHFYRCLTEAWEAISQDTIDDLVRGVVRRVEMLDDAEGWYTKY